MDDREIAQFPPALRALIEAEAAAGNAVVEIGHGFPAAPVAAFARLARRVSTRPRETGGGLKFHERNSSLWSGEWTDAKDFYFVLEPPLAEPSPETAPARPATSEPPPAPKPLRYTVDIDLRGETLIYREPDREATVICTFGGDPCLVPRTLSRWWYPAERRSEPMSDEEKERLIARIADYCRTRHGMSRLRFEGE